MEGEKSAVTPLVIDGNGTHIEGHYTEQLACRLQNYDSKITKVVNRKE